MLSPLSPLRTSTSVGFFLKQCIWMLCLTLVIRCILPAVGIGPSHSSPLPISLHTFATNLGTSGSVRVPRTLSLLLFRLGNICLMMESLSVWHGLLSLFTPRAFLGSDLGHGALGLAAGLSASLLVLSWPTPGGRRACFLDLHSPPGCIPWHARPLLSTAAHLCSPSWHESPSLHLLYWNSKQ